MKVVIIGAGIGGYACAIACSQQGLEVVLLERTPEIKPVGAGIQLPPNATRVNRHLGTLEEILSKGTTLDAINLRRYQNGKILHQKPCGEFSEKTYGAPWIVIHRADYYDVLANRARELGVKTYLGVEVEAIDFEKTTVLSKDGRCFPAEVIIGADGLWSICREQLFGFPYPPIETGDLAYRGTFTRQQLEALNDTRLSDLCDEKKVNVWLGPEKHAVFYPTQGGEQFNLVLIRPDNLPKGTRQSAGEIDEMRASFEGWDSILSKIIFCVPSVTKWKLCNVPELRTWVKKNVALLGDSVHPTLPYQAQGAAMAVEDGAVLGELLGLTLRHNSLKPSERIGINSTLRLYESLRKKRTTTNVQGATSNQYWYHLPDGDAQRGRDVMCAEADGVKSSEWNFLDPSYNADLLGFDTFADARAAFVEKFGQTD